MIFGDKMDFAIEAMVEPDLKVPSSVWGRMCVWVAGVSIGDYDDHYCGLGAPESGFSEKCDQIDDLWIVEFETMSDSDIWNFLDGKLYNWNGNIELEDDRTLDQIRSDDKQYSKFNFLTNWGEMFDRGGKSFLLAQPDGMLKVLNYDYENSKVNNYLCSKFGFRRAVKCFCDWYAQQRTHLSGNNI